MRKAVFAALLSVILIAVLFALLFFRSRSDSELSLGREGGRSSLEQEGGLDPSSSRRGLSETAELAREVGDDQDLQSAAARAATLSGTVADELYEPLGGARVFILEERDPFALFGGFRGGRDISRLIRERILDRDKERGGSGVVAETVTASDGKYAFSIAELPRGTYRVYADHDGYAADNESWTWAPESHVIDFRLGGGDVITGIVLDRKDRPIAMATVEAFPDRSDQGRRGRRGGFGGRESRQAEARTSADSEGRFRLTLATGTYRLRGSAAGHSPDSVDDVEAGTRDVVIVLGPSRQLSGKVRDVDGNALEGASVALHVGGAVGRDFGRGGRGPGGRGRGGRGPGGGERGAEPRRDPGSGVSERVGRWRWFSSPVATVETTAGGEFLFEDVPVERLALSAEKSGYVTGQVVRDLSEPEEDASRPERARETVEIVLERGAVVAGIVKDHEGDPVPAAFVAVAEDEGDRDRFGFGGRGRFGRGRGEEGQEAEDELREAEPVSYFGLRDGTETDTEGRFSFDTLPKGEYSLSVESEEHPVYRIDELVLEEDRTLDIALEEGMSLRGKVTSGRDGKPVGGASLRFSFSRRNQKEAKTTETGEYKLEGFLASLIEEVSISAPGHSTTYFTRIEVGPGTQDFELEPTAEIRGEVVNARGEPIARARVALSPAVELDTEDFRGMFRQTMRMRRRETTDVDGRFHFADVNGGQEYYITVEHVEYRRLDADKVEVRSGEIVDDLRLVMKMGARIEVLARNPNGYAVPGGRVDVSRLLSDAERAEREEEVRGRFGEGSDPEARRQEGMRRMFERISRGDRGATSRRSRNTGPDGKAVFSGMASGSYLIHVEAREFQHFYIRTVAADDQVTSVTADLLPENVITGRVVSSLTGEPVAGAEVTALRENPDRAAQAGSASADDRMAFRGRGRSREERSESRSDPDGSFRLGGLGASTYTVRVRARGFAETRREQVSVNQDIAMAVDPLGAVAGWVRTLETGLPIAAFRLRLREESAGSDDTGDAGPGGREGFGRGFGRRGGFPGRGGSGRWRQFEDPQGAFLVENLEAGKYDLEVVAEGFTGSRLTVEVRIGAITDGILVSLDEGLSVGGTVVRKDTAAPMAGALVYLLPVAEQAVGEDEGERESGRRTRRLTTGGRRSARSRRLSSEEEAKLAFAALERVGPNVEGQTTSDDGAFKIPEVPEGRYELVVDHESCVPLRREVIVSSRGMLSDYILQMDPGESLSGTVALEGREPGAGCAVTVQTTDGYSKRTETDAEGRYRLSGLLPGEYGLSIRSGEQAIVRGQAVTVKEGKENRFDYRP